MQFDQAYGRLQASLDQVLASNLPNDQACLQLLQAVLPESRFTLKGTNTLERQAYEDKDKALLDDGLRQYALQLLFKAGQAGQPLMQYSLQGSSTAALPKLFECVCWMCQAQMVTPEGSAATVRLLDLISYCRLLEELLEAATISDGQALFAHMEAGPLLHFLEQESGTSQSSKLCVLRSCNGLLRRLSKAQDLQLCGRILIYIARMNPLADKSGVNLHGQVNSGLHLVIDEVGPTDVDSSGEPIDAKLYATFWGLQATFKNPSSCFQQTVWSKTAADLGAVLDALEARKVTVKASPSFTTEAHGNSNDTTNNATTSTSGMEVEEAGRNNTTTTSNNNAAAVTVKYLSSSKLFGLQLRDATFRRQFLTQALILLHHLRTPGKSDKEKTSGGAAAAAAAGGADAGQRYEGLDELQTRVTAAMSATDDNGADFAAAVQHVLDRETRWVDWKNKGCIPFEKPPAAPLKRPPGMAVSGMAAEAASGPPAKRRRVGGRGASSASTVASLLRQVAVPADQMAGLKVEDRKVGEQALLPTFQEYVQPVLDDLNPENSIETEYHHLNTDRVFAWKVMRFISRTQLQQLQNQLKTSETPSQQQQQDLAKQIGAAVMECLPEFKKQFEAAAKELAAAAAAREPGGGGDAAMADAVAGTEQQQDQEQRTPAPEDIAVLKETLISKLGMTAEQLGQKLVSMGSDGCNALMGHETGVQVQMQQNIAPFMQSIWCHAHRGQLAAKVLKDEKLLEDITEIVNLVSTHFCKSPQRQGQLQQCQKQRKSKPLKVLHNAQTRWISLYAPLQRLFDILPDLLLYFSQASDTGSGHANGIYQRLVNPRELFGIAAFLPMLRSLNAFIMQCQLRGACPLSLRKAVTVLKNHITKIYLSREEAYDAIDFPELASLENIDQDNSLLCSDDEGYACFKVTIEVAEGEEQPGPFQLLAIPTPEPGKRGGNRRNPMPVSSEDLSSSAAKEAATDPAESLIAELSTRFPVNDVLEGCELLTAEYWCTDPDVKDQRSKMQKLQAAFGQSKVLMGNPASEPLQPLLDSAKLHQQLSVLRIIAPSEAKKLMQTVEKEDEAEADRQKQIAEQYEAGQERHSVEALPEHPPVITRFWRALTVNGAPGYEEWAKAAQLVVAMVAGSVEEERCFSAMNFIKNEQRNRLTVHLEACVRIFTQQQFDIDTFPYEKAYSHWLRKVDRRLHLS